ncbi:MAG: putative nickel-responsive regulator [Euryarchaeota archaeon ADurb.Bin023]|nr:MAG: putative nickel-responsive regulator [Euryarchaeota archaeon ADurb.Bin023]
MIICTKYQNNIKIGCAKYVDNRNSYIDISPIYHTDARGTSMKLISVQIPEAYMNGLDELVNYGYFPNKSEAIRSAIRDMLKNELGGFRSLRNEGISGKIK